ncbi:MAG TPA: tryptophan synthase subunit alpha [Xanthomonadales bacterium]|nr:tryptophan synthase subunit alpha [Xanthomonadales bacterium]
MNRIDKRFAQLRASSRAGLVPFVTAGDPDPAQTVPVMHALVAAGADLIELGVPFSDPMADGPVIQRASERALARGTGLAKVLGMVREFRTRDAVTPVVLMGYLNPIEVHGWERFAAEAHEAGVDGLLLVDLPPEEAAALRDPLAKHGIAQIFLVAPTTVATRVTRIAAAAHGFVYYVSFAGITGADKLALDDVASRVATLKRATSVPVAVGFGVRDAEQAGAIAKFADAVVIGSALVEVLAEATDAPAAAGRFLAPIRAAVDAARPSV